MLNFSVPGAKTEARHSLSTADRKTSMRAASPLRRFSWMSFWFKKTPALGYLFLFVILSIACGSSPPFTVDKFQSTYDTFSNNETRRVIVVYTPATNEYTKSTYSYNPSVLLSTDQNNLSPEKQAALISLLNSLDIKNYSSEYTEPPAAHEGDASYVTSAFYSGSKSKTIKMDTNNESTVPAKLMDFCRSIRSATFF